MENKFYTNEERLLVNIGKLAQAIQLDLKLLQLEEQVGLMDGLPLEAEEKE